MQFRSWHLSSTFSLFGRLADETSSRGAAWLCKVPESVEVYRHRPLDSEAGEGPSTYPTYPNTYVDQWRGSTKKWVPNGSRFLTLAWKPLHCNWILWQIYFVILDWFSCFFMLFRLIPWRIFDYLSYRLTCILLELLVHNQIFTTWVPVFPYGSLWFWNQAWLHSATCAPHLPRMPA